MCYPLKFIILTATGTDATIFVGPIVVCQPKGCSLKKNVSFLIEQLRRHYHLIGGKIVDQAKASSDSSDMKHSINRVALLVGGDFLTLFLFIWVGRIRHSFASTDIGGTLAVAAPFLLSWFGITPWFGLFQGPTSRNWRRLIPRLLLAWAIGGPLALVLRNLFLGRPLIGGIIPSFAAIMLLGTTIFLLMWRLAYIRWANRRSN